MSRTTSSIVNSDEGLLDLLRRGGALNIAELMSAMQVTATAVRQRLARLTRDGLIQREAARAGRGRPSHRYSLTDKGRRQGGSNFADLTIALWQEVRSIKDPAVRGGLLRRLAKALAGAYGGRLNGRTTEERMRGVTGLMADRNVPFTVDRQGLLPVLVAEACPYPDLAEQDRGICAVERMLFSELVGEKVRLSQCRLDGASCCRFETN